MAGDDINDFEPKTQQEIEIEEHIEELEKQQRKKGILEEYYDYIDRINLTKLKLLFRDHMGNQFIPK